MVVKYSAILCVFFADVRQRTVGDLDLEIEFPSALCFVFVIHLHQVVGTCHANRSQTLDSHTLRQFQIVRAISRHSVQ